MAKIYNVGNENVPINSMKDGDIAEIISWDTVANSLNRGDIIIRYDTVIIPLGKPSGASYPNLLSVSAEALEKVRVRILKKGELIQV
jgi:hypothetical protein